MRFPPQRRKLANPLRAGLGGAIALSFILASCVALQQSTKPIHGTIVLLTPVATYTYGATDGFPTETTLVVRDPASWQNAWDRITHTMIPAPNLPQVDFTTNIVLIVSAGVEPTGGYSVAIVQALENDDAVTVEWTITSPGASCVVPQVVTAPVDIVKIPATNASITFKVSRKTQNC